MLEEFRDSRAVAGSRRRSELLSPTAEEEPQRQFTLIACPLRKLSYRLRKSLASPVMAAVVICAPVAAGATYAYTGGDFGTPSAPLSGAFSSGFAPAFPSDARGAILSFGGGENVHYIATNDMEKQVIARLSLDSASLQTQSIVGNTLYLSDLDSQNSYHSPAITQIQVGSFAISADVDTASLPDSNGTTGLSYLTLDGAGTGGVTFLGGGGTHGISKSGPYTATFEKEVLCGDGGGSISVTAGTLNLNAGYSGVAGSSLFVGTTATLNINGPVAIDNLKASISTGGSLNLTSDISLATINASVGGLVRVFGSGKLTATTGAVTVSGGGSLTLDNRVSPEAIDRVGDNVGITLTGSNLNYVGGSDGNSEIAGQLTLKQASTASLPHNADLSTVTLTSTSSNAATSMTFSGLSKPANSLALMRGTGLGSVSTGEVGTGLFFNTAPDFVGSSILGSSTARGIVPTILVDQSATGTGSSFATYDSERGMRPLEAGDFVTTLAASGTPGTERQRQQLDL